MWQVAAPSWLEPSVVMHPAVPESWVSTPVDALRWKISREAGESSPAMYTICPSGLNAMS